MTRVDLRAPCALLLILLAASPAAAEPAADPATEAPAEPALLDPAETGYPFLEITAEFADETLAPGGAWFSGDRYFVSDFKNNRVLVFDRARRRVGLIGSAGDREGELLRPTNLAGTRGGEIFVRELGNDRVQVFRHDGSARGQVPLKEFVGLAVDSAGHLYVGKPENGALVSVYDRQGELLRTFGKLRLPSEIYGEEHAELDATSEKLINRVDLAIDRQDNVYVTFLFVPIVHKYSPRGKLLWALRLDGPVSNELERLFLSDEEKSGRRYVRTIMDGRAANYVASDSAYSPAGWLAVLLPNRALIVVDEHARASQVYHLRLSSTTDEEARFQPAAVSAGPDAELLLVDPFYETVWRTIVPPPKVDG